MDTNKTNEPSGGGLTGWKCPVCGRGNSPFSQTCPCRVNPPMTPTIQPFPPNPYPPHPVYPTVTYGPGYPQF